MLDALPEEELYLLLVAEEAVAVGQDYVRLLGRAKTGMSAKILKALSSKDYYVEMITEQLKIDVIELHSEIHHAVSSFAIARTLTSAILHLNSLMRLLNAIIL